MQTVNSNSDTKPNGFALDWWLFIVILLVFGSSYLALTFLARNITPLQYVRQPMLVMGAIVLLFKYPNIPVYKSGNHLIGGLVGLFLFYAVFNIALSLSPSNSIFYLVWLLTSWFFMFRLAGTQCYIGNEKLLKTSLWAIFSLMLLINLSSYIGGYVFGNPLFFDERFNYTAGQLKLEFGGIFGSNNSIGLIGFITLATWLLLALHEGWHTKWFFWPINLIWLINLLHIGNRSSMLCGFVLIILYMTVVFRQVLMTLLLIAGMIYIAYEKSDFLAEKLRLDQFEDDNLLGNRGELIEEGRLVLQETHFFGVGFANQRAARFRYLNVSEDEKNLNFHNSYIALAVEWGYLGAILYLAIILIPIIFYSTKPKPLSLKSELRLTAIILLVIVVFYMPFEDSVNSPGSPVFLFFWMLWFWFWTTIDADIQPEMTIAKLKTHAPKP